MECRVRAQELAAALLDAGAVRLSPGRPFTWASGLKSPIYCDNRQLLGFPQLRRQIAGVLAGRAKDLAPTLVAGTSTAGIPWAALVADTLDLPMAYVRPEPKKHGMGRQVEGPNVKGQRVVLLEDLISTGGSSLRCAQALQAEGAELLQVLALFSYGLPQAEQAFAAAGVACSTLAGFDDLRALAAERSLLDAAELEALAAWRPDPAAWSARFDPPGAAQ
jgi:orotate phosphoribosyltransferase